MRLATHKLRSFHILFLCGNLSGKRDVCIYSFYCFALQNYLIEDDTSKHATNVCNGILVTERSQEGATDVLVR